MAIEILSISANLQGYGGAQRMLLDIHNGIKERYDAKILGFPKFEEVHSNYHINKSEYIRFINPFFLNNKILLVHSRNVMAFIMVLKTILFLNTKIIYVSHNVFNNLRELSFFPNSIISISNKVTQNLIYYFNIKSENIRLIHNGIKDKYQHTDKLTSYRKRNKIVILYLARINGIKRQLEIIENLKDKLLPEIEIHFAGTGPDYKKLAEKCAPLSNFKALGFLENINDVIIDSDYLMLFSTQEGLPISLIEGAMYGKPLLVNDIGGNLEIGVPGINGILLADDWNKLSKTLNNLISLSDQEYIKMSVNSRKRFENFFTYDKMISKYLDIIKTSIYNS